MCGYYSPSEPLAFLSSGNVMLVTMATNANKNYPGFRATVSQIYRSSKGRNSSLSMQLSFRIYLKYFSADEFSVHGFFSLNRDHMWWSAQRREGYFHYS